MEKDLAFQLKQAAKQEFVSFGEEVIKIGQAIKDSDLTTIQSQMHLLGGIQVRCGIYLQSVGELMGICRSPNPPSLDEIKKEFIKRKINFPDQERVSEEVKSPTFRVPEVVDLTYHMDD